MSDNSTNCRPLAQLKMLETVKEHLPSYSEYGPAFIESVEQAYTVEDLLAVDINARSTANGLSRMMFDERWLTPEGEILDQRVRLVRQTIRALRLIAAAAMSASATAPDLLPDGTARAGVLG